MIPTSTPSVRMSPRYLPRRKRPRPTGFERMVKIVLRSISLDTRPIPTKIAISVPKIEMLASPRSVMIRACCPIASWLSATEAAMSPSAKKRRL